MALSVQLLPMSPGDASQAQPMTSFLINKTIALDAGSLGFALLAEQLASIEHVILSHAHLDHTASLPVAIDAAYPLLRKPMRVYGTAQTLQTVRRNLFNEDVWVDFTDFNLPGSNTPCLQWVPIEPRQPFQLGALRFTPIPVSHAVPTLGFIVESRTEAVIFTSDTFSTGEIWQAGSRIPNLRAVFIECSYPNEFADLAAQACHMTPQLVAGEVAKLKRSVETYCVHLKPSLRERILPQLASYAAQNIQVMQIGRTYTWG